LTAFEIDPMPVDRAAFTVLATRATAGEIEDVVQVSSA
jgi:hypothetical protein